MEASLTKLLPFVSETFAAIDKLLDDCGKSLKERKDEGEYLSNEIRELLLSRLKKHEADKEEHERKMLEAIERYKTEIIESWTELNIAEADCTEPIDLWILGKDDSFVNDLTLVQRYRFESKRES